MVHLIHKLISTLKNILDLRTIPLIEHPTSIIILPHLFV